MPEHKARLLVGMSVRAAHKARDVANLISWPQPPTKETPKNWNPHLPRPTIFIPGQSKNVFTLSPVLKSLTYLQLQTKNIVNLFIQQNYQQMKKQLKLEETK